MVSDILKFGQGLRWVGARPSTTAWGSGVTQILAIKSGEGFTLGGSGQIWHINPIFGSGLGCAPVECSRAGRAQMAQRDGRNTTAQQGGATGLQQQ
jgi:hypothetical protein